MANVVLGVLGGSGLYQMAGLKEIEEIAVTTPFGAPSDSLIRGELGGHSMLFLPRHGRNHTLSPSAINYRANIHAFKQLGATHIVSVSAVGSLREEIAPGHLVVPNQFIDFTRGRNNSFFDDIVAHVSMADPVCPHLASALASSAEQVGATVHTNKTYVCIEGPRFSTRAESHMFRNLGADVIGMTNVPEAFLAREAELPYATLALSTDYDCWRPHDDVDVTSILEIVRRNVERAQKTLAQLVTQLPDPTKSPAYRAAEQASLTKLESVTSAQRAKYALLLSRWLNRS